MRNANACSLGAALLLAACLSSAPPAPPVRWFDPLPAAAVETSARPTVDLRVTAAGHLGREFVVRTAPREVVFDGQHGWIDEPVQLVAAALGARLQQLPGDGGNVMRVAVEAFEVDVQGEPRAVVRLVVQFAGRRRDVEAQEPAAGRSPAALAAAMAGALGRAAGAVAAIARGE
ncbi:MAG: membrane integrity-associated transporter subunit PqiC [Planctomycetes bacterium]|nr:membrane integrity-associated transporter subunit PqiC [Planctomycetota bacterium]